MSIAFDHDSRRQRVLFGTGDLLRNLGHALDGLQSTRVLLISDTSARVTADRVAREVTVVGRIHKIQQHVPAADAREAVVLAESTHSDTVIAIGGGSAIGLAKIVARDAGLPIIAIPTTFAGSEATPVWGITEDGRKVTGVDEKVVPTVVVYDPSLLTSLPTHLTMASGLNAVAHAVDGFWAPGANPIAAALGTEGLRALVPGLRGLQHDPQDVAALERTLYGAYLAGVAFASSGSGMHHKICHVLGGAYGLAHADMHAIVLPYVTAFNTPAAPSAADRLAEILDNENPAQGLFDLREELGVPGSLSALGLAEADLPEASRLALEAIPKSNPRPVELEDVDRILRAAHAGAVIN